MSDFIAGFAARHAVSTDALAQAFASAPVSFAPAHPRERVAPSGPAPASFAPKAPGPKHFSPANRDANPTEGWDPLDPVVEDTPYIDSLHAAHAAGYAEGLAAAQAAVNEAGERDRALLAGLLDQLAAGREIDREGIAAALRQTVLMLVAKTVGEAGVSPELLAGRVEKAAEFLADATESALLRVHPEDVPLLEGRLPRNLFPVGDAAVARGSFVLESASTVIEDGPALWLDQLSAAVDKVAVPPC